MKTVEFEVPAMYGDHHVIEVRNTILEMDGVKDVYASSAFRAVEVTFDPKKTSEDEIRSKLEEMGYLGEWALPVETAAAPASEGNGSQAYFRHTQVYETAQNVVGFKQEVSYSGRPLWYCPGFGVIKSEMED